MKSIQFQIQSFLEDQTGPFTNLQGVEFDLDFAEMEITACCLIPGFVSQNKYSLELLYGFHPLYKFIRDFHLDSLEDLENINPKTMEQFFNSGRTELWCHIYPSENYLVFRKEQEDIRVVDDEMYYILGTPLIAHEDFHAYTRYYFSE